VFWYIHLSCHVHYTTSRPFITVHSDNSCILRGRLQVWSDRSKGDLVDHDSQSLSHAEEMNEGTSVGLRDLWKEARVMQFGVHDQYLAALHNSLASLGTPTFQRAGLNDISPGKTFSSPSAIPTDSPLSHMIWFSYSMGKFSPSNFSAKKLHFFFPIFPHLCSSSDYICSSRLSPPRTTHTTIFAAQDARIPTTSWITRH
jgi:hypothetical protein